MRVETMDTTEALGADQLESEKQRISLSVDGQRLSLRVERTQERLFREASLEIAQTIRLYRGKYPNTSEVPSEGYLAMATIDLAVRHEQLREALVQRQADLAPRLRRLNDSIDSLLATTQQLLDEEA